MPVPMTDTVVIETDLATRVFAAVERIADHLRRRVPGFAGLGVTLDEHATTPAAGYRLTLLVRPEHLDEAKRFLGNSLTLRVQGQGKMDFPLNVRRAARLKYQARRKRS